MGSEDEAGPSPREGEASLSESGQPDLLICAGLEGRRLPGLLRGLLSTAKETHDTPTETWGWQP